MEMTMFEQEREYWNRRYNLGGNSGAGSYGDPMQRKVDALCALAGVESIIEVGCGDFNFGQCLTDRLPTVQYRGLDVSDVIVERNQKLFKRSSPRVTFEAISGSRFPAADLVLCIDVLFHISGELEYQGLLDSLDKAWTKYLAVTAYEYDGTRHGHIHIREFDPERFGTPILREVIEEDGSLYFYIFKK